MTEDDVVRGQRFSGGPARGFLSSLADDERLFEADLAVDRAHGVMLAEQGIITNDDAATILIALDTVEDAGFDALPQGEDVHAAIETSVVEIAGDAGRRMHTARSRNDEVATCIRYQLREDLLDAVDATLALRETLQSVAADHDTTVLPGYTHLQPAQPTTLAHWLLSYDSALARDIERLFDAYDRTNQSPLGAAAFAGTPYPIDRAHTAELLGFEDVIENAMDAVTTRDFLIETAAALTALGTTVAGLATDGIQYADRGWLDLADDYASTSSIMPQKVNPDTLELARATLGDATAAFTGITTTVGKLPRAYNRDLQRATPHIWSSVDAVTDATTVVAGAIATATWDEDAMATAADAGFTTATGVADRLTMAGVPFRTAHRIVADAATEGGDHEAITAATETHLGKPLDEVIDPDDLASVLDPATEVTTRDSVGGPAPQAIADSLQTAEADRTDQTDTLTEYRTQLRTAADQLAAAVESYR